MPPIDEDISPGDPLHVEHHEALAAGVNAAATSAALASHASDTTGIHGISDTSLLLTTTSQMPGYEIDRAERMSSFDVKAVGTTSTEIDGATIIVPPQTQPYELQLDLLAYWVSGTAAIAAQMVFLCQVQEYWYVGTTLNFSTRMQAITGYTQVTAASKTVLQSVSARKVVEPHTGTKYYRTMSALLAAAPANWTTGQFIMDIGQGADNSASSSLGYQPGLLRAVTL